MLTIPQLALRILGRSSRIRYRHVFEHRCMSLWNLPLHFVVSNCGYRLSFANTIPQLCVEQGSHLHIPVREGEKLLLTSL